MSAYHRPLYEFTLSCFGAQTTVVACDEHEALAKARKENTRFDHHWRKGGGYKVKRIVAIEGKAW
jgi:hypothetical protein